MHAHRAKNYCATSKGKGFLSVRCEAVTKTLAGTSHEEFLRNFNENIFLSHRWDPVIMILLFAWYCVE